MFWTVEANSGDPRRLSDACRDFSGSPVGAHRIRLDQNPIDNCQTSTTKISSIYPSWQRHRQRMSPCPRVFLTYTVPEQTGPTKKRMNFLLLKSLPIPQQA